MNTAHNQADRARLIAVSSRHAGDFLNAIPSSTVGTRLDNTSLRIAVGLLLGSNICSPLVCVCAVSKSVQQGHMVCLAVSLPVVTSGTTQSMISSNERWHQQRLTPAILEPASLSRSDGKRPDGLSIVPWTRGRALMWDFTCPDTLALSHLNRAVVGPSAVANEA